MSSVLQQLPVLIGVIVGAFCSYLVGAAADRSRWRRERAARWDLRRMETYAAYGHAVKTCTMLAARVAAERGIGERLEPISIKDGLAQLAEAQLTRATLWEPVLLLGDPATIATARRWHEASWRLDGFARQMSHPDDTWDAAMNAANDARAAFYQAARKDLGVTGTPPPTQFPRRNYPTFADEPYTAPATDLD